MDVPVTVCALFYGGPEYQDLHQRCLDSLRRLAPYVELRLCLNAVTNPETVIGARELEAQGALLIAGENTPKYRRMRELFQLRPLREAVMWFDDDSALERQLDVPSWLQRVHYWATARGLIGSLYRAKWRLGQQTWVASQPWYQGRPFQPHIQFVTGGWWVASRELLESTGWPWAALSHNGGDTMLGVCLEQQQQVPFHFREGVLINADYQGRESRAPRRGLSEPPIGTGYGTDTHPH